MFILYVLHYYFFCFSQKRYFIDKTYIFFINFNGGA